MHSKSAEPTAAEFARRLNASGYSGRDLEQILMVGQSTVSRLRHGLIRDVRRHVAAFDGRTAKAVEDAELERMSAELLSRGRVDPAVRALIADICRVMHIA